MENHNLNKKTAQKNLNGFNIFASVADRYIIPGIPPPIGIAGSALLISVITHSVVNSIPETEAAFSRATLVTFVGSMIPASSMLTYSPIFRVYKFQCK